MDTQNKIRNRLKRYKKANRYSFRELAKEIGVNESWLTKFAKGDRKSPSYEHMRIVWKYLMRKDK